MAVWEGGVRFATIRREIDVEWNSNSKQIMREDKTKSTRSRTSNSSFRWRAHRTCRYRRLFPAAFPTAGKPCCTQYRALRALFSSCALPADAGDGLLALHGDTSFTNSPQGDYDATYESIRLLLRGNGVDGQIFVADDGPEHIGLTMVGNTRISAKQSKFGGSSIAIDGAGDYILMTYSSAFDFGAGDFTIETFVYKNANNINGTRVWNPNGDYYDCIAL